VTRGNQGAKKDSTNAGGRKSGSKTGSGWKRGGDNGAGKTRAEEDRQLVDRCLTDDEQAWRELYGQQQPGLLKASKLLLVLCQG